LRPMTSNIARPKKAEPAFDPEDEEIEASQRIEKHLNIKSFSDQYESILIDYLENKGEGSLLHAYELGRDALALNMGLLDLSMLHQKAVMSLLNDRVNQYTHAKMLFFMESASRFYEEVLSPYELSRLSSLQLNAMLPRLYEAFEMEAKRIAHILHDESAQTLAVAYMEINEVSLDAENADYSREKISNVLALLENVREQLRTLSHELRPLILDQLGLIPALKLLVNGVKERAGLKIEIIGGELVGRMPQQVETLMYRVVQEALANVSRHAKADTVTVRIWLENGALKCSVSDDGVGFNSKSEDMKEAQGIGLLGMKERVAALGGNFVVDSEVGKGTVLISEIPLC